MRDDPCFSCTLPDCDDRSPACRIRRLFASYNSKIRRGERDAITDSERLAMSRRIHDWELERLVEASEGGRSYQRPSSAKTVSP